MKTDITTALRTYIRTRIVKTFARCWLIVTVRGDRFGFTSHTRDIIFAGVTYLSTAGFQMSDLRSSEGMVPDTADVATFLTTTNEALVVAGVFDNAYLEIFTVNYHDLTMSRIVEKSAYFGEISRSDGILNVELRGLTQILDTKIGEVFSASCQADLGDERCGVELYPVSHMVSCDLTGNSIVRQDAGSFIDDGFVVGRTLVITDSLLGNNLSAVILTVTEDTLTLDGVTFVAETDEMVTLSQSSAFFAEGEVTSILVPKKSFTLDITNIDRFYSQGVVIFTSGANSGFKRDIRVQIENEYTVYLPFPYPIAIGDTVEVIAGCNKQASTCEEKFNNKLRFRGFDFVPTQEDIFYSPLTNSISTDPEE